MAFILTGSRTGWSSTFVVFERIGDSRRNHCALLSFWPLSLPPLFPYSFCSYDHQSIMEYNGGDVIAMAGKECVGIAADTRLGCQAQTVATDFQKIFKVELLR